jgi:hypothetical protein
MTHDPIDPLAAFRGTRPSRAERNDPRRRPEPGRRRGAAYAARRHQCLHHLVRPLHRGLHRRLWPFCAQGERLDDQAMREFRSSSRCCAHPPTATRGGITSWQTCVPTPPSAPAASHLDCGPCGYVGLDEAAKAVTGKRSRCQQHVVTEGGSGPHRRAARHARTLRGIAASARTEGRSWFGSRPAGYPAGLRLTPGRQRVSVKKRRGPGPGSIVILQ